MLGKTVRVKGPPNLVEEATDSDIVNTSTSRTQTELTDSVKVLTPSCKKKKPGKQTTVKFTNQKLIDEDSN